MSMHGCEVGQRLVETVLAGEPVTIVMEEGGPVTWSAPEEALPTLMEHFDWKRPINWEDDQLAAYVLSVCQRMEERFSLREVVHRIAEERPEMVVQFASLWGRLVQHRLVRKIRNFPSVYELAADQQWP